VIAVAIDSRELKSLLVKNYVAKSRIQSKENGQPSNAELKVTSSKFKVLLENICTSVVSKFGQLEVQHGAKEKIHLAKYHLTNGKKKMKAKAREAKVTGKC
jgi:hypothetical protein